MSKLDEWGSDYPLFLREVAKVFASGPYEYGKGGSDNIHETVYTKIELYPSIKQWLGYYRNHKDITPAIISLMFSPGNDEDSINRELTHSLKNIVSENELGPEDIYQKMAISDTHSKEVLEHHFGKDGLDSAQEGKEATRNNPSGESGFNSPEALFLSKVTVPCFICYGDLPAFIYRKARTGDIDSICKLLQIDKRVIADHRIADAINFASLDINSDEFKKICKAFSGTFNFPSTGKMKTHFAKLIKTYFNSFGFDIKAPQIQALFDATHEHYNPGESVDRDLAETPHGFYMAIKRKKGLLLPKEKPHKK